MVKIKLTRLFVSLALFCLATEAHAETVRPKLKPVGLVPARASDAPPVSTLTFPKVGSAHGWSRKTIQAGRQECADRLSKLKLDFETMAPFGSEGGCGTAAGILVSGVAGVAVVPPAELTCDMAEALHGWVANAVQPAALRYLKKRLVKINNASAYACRRRNGLASGKLSEHGKANALDIATLAFDDGTSVNIKGDWSGLARVVNGGANRKFLQEIRNFACIRFTTVLGPGSDKYHGDHFHIDVARRNNGYRICK